MLGHDTSHPNSTGSLGLLQAPVCKKGVTYELILRIRATELELRLPNGGNRWFRDPNRFEMKLS